MGKSSKHLKLSKRENALIIELCIFCVTSFDMQLNSLLFARHETISRITEVLDTAQICQQRYMTVKLHNPYTSGYREH